MASILQHKVCLAVEQAGVYSIMADKTKDHSKVEQLPLFLDMLMLLQPHNMNIF